MRIRPEQPENEGDVEALHRTAFGDHGEAVAGLVPDLRTLLGAGQGVSLVAEDDQDVIVGHVMTTPALLDTPRRLIPVEVLSPLAVLPQRQGLGIGSALVRAALDHAAQRSVPAVFLEGDPGYYSRLGFRPGGDLGFRRPSLRIPEAAFQVVMFVAQEPSMTGTLVYPDAFWRHDAVGLRDDPA